MPAKMGICNYERRVKVRETVRPINPLHYNELSGLDFHQERFE
jgi:hypothetical protein